MTDSNERDAGARKRRGFAAMNPERQREIASAGGKAATQSGRAHQFTIEEARAGARKRHMGAAAAQPRSDQPR